MSDFVNREAEGFLLGQLMVDSEIIPAIAKQLGTDPKVFRSVSHQLIYKAILESYEISSTVTPVLVFEILERDGDLNRAGGADYLYQLDAVITETESAPSYARIIKEAAARRQAIWKAEQIRAVATDTTQPPEAVDDLITEAASDIRNQKTKTDTNDIIASIPFPDELIDGIFEQYINAYRDRSEVSIPFLFGTLKTIIGASLGRRVYLDAPSFIYPNFYTCLVGHTALARKSTALILAEKMLSRADMGVFVLRSVATPEGLIAALTLPETEEEKGLIRNREKLDAMRDRVEVGVEGVRMCLSIDEFSHLLKKAGKPHGDGLIQTLSTAYNYPTELQNPTRVDALVADHPCVSLIGATTLHWLESSLKLEDIQGGFANRITYYLGTKSKRLYKALSGHAGLLGEVAKTINSLRFIYPNPTMFTEDEMVDELAQAWYENYYDELEQQDNPLVLMASARTDLHVKKLSLLFSVLENEYGDTLIHEPAFNKAVILAEYLQKVVAHLYANFNFSDEKRLETKIVELLNKKPNRTARELNRSVKWASAKQINASIEELVKSGTLGTNQAGKRVEYKVLENWQ